MKCASCKREIIKSDEAEYSDYLTEVFCSPDCATDKYYEFMGSHPLEWKLVKELEKERECEKLK